MILLLVGLLAVQSDATPNVTVLDATSGEPITGAQVMGVAESLAPIWGELWSSHSVTTDSTGRAFLPPSEPGNAYGWCIVRADGYAISGAMETPRPGVPVEVALHPSIPSRIRVVDFVGRPISVVHLGLCVGCGHTPDVASAVTGPDGWATLGGVGAEPSREIADVYPVGGGIMTDYLDVDWDAAQAGGFTAHAAAGDTLRGRLVLANGEPAAGYYIGTNHRHRGPWTRTGADGRFVFHGVEAGHCPYLNVRPPAGEIFCSFEGSRLSMERLLRLPAEDWGAERTGPTGTLAVTLEIPGDGERLALAWPEGTVPVEVWDPATGWSELRQAKIGVPMHLELTAGEYEVEVGGKGSPFRRRGIGTVTVPDAESGGIALIRLGLEAPLIVSLDVEGYADTGSVSLRTGSSAWKKIEFDSRVEAGADTGPTGTVEHFAVPAEPFGLWIHSQSTSQYYDQLELTPVEEEAGDSVTGWHAKPTRR